VSRQVGIEFVVTAASSDPGFTDARSAAAVSANPDVRYYAAHNGSLRVHVDRARWRAEFMRVDAKRPDGLADVAARWALESGSPVAQRT
jgi:hypothetical protein